MNLKKKNEDEITEKEKAAIEKELKELEERCKKKKEEEDKANNGGKKDKKKIEEPKKKKVAVDKNDKKKNVKDKKKDAEKEPEEDECSEVVNPCGEVPAEFDPSDTSNWDKMDFLEETYSMSLINSSIYKHEIRMTYVNSTLHGMKSRFLMFHTLDGTDQPDMYGEWRFHNGKAFDDFYYNTTRNNILYSSEFHTVGK